MGRTFVYSKQARILIDPFYIENMELTHEKVYEVLQRQTLKELHCANTGPHLKSKTWPRFCLSISNLSPISGLQGSRRSFENIRRQHRRLHRQK